MQEHNRRRRFEQIVMPHLDAAYNLARWLTRNDHDAEDLVQEAYCGRTGSLIAFTVRKAGRGSWRWCAIPATPGSSNTVGMRLPHLMRQFIAATARPSIRKNSFSSKATRQLLHEALEELPPEFREVVVLASWKAIRTRR